MTLDFAARAQALVGTSFRLQGRSTQGLDCIGVAIATFDLPADCLPRNYRVREFCWEHIREHLERHFRRVRATQLRPGDLMVVQVASDQIHFAVRTAAGFVHAHAGLRRVVETPGMPHWPLISVQRKRKS